VGPKCPGEERIKFDSIPLMVCVTNITRCFDVYIPPSLKRLIIIIIIVIIIVVVDVTVTIIINVVSLRINSKMNYE